MTNVPAATECFQLIRSLVEKVDLYDNETDLEIVRLCKLGEMHLTPSIHDNPI